MSDDFVKKDFSDEEIAWHNKQEALLEEMGLESRDVNQLQKQMMSADEAVSAKAEELTRIRQHKGRKDNWQEFLDSKARMGYVMHGGDLLYTLRNVIPGLMPYDGRVIGTIGLASPVVRTFEDGYHQGYQYLGWIYKDWNPEFTIDYCDEDGVPRGKRQGWRALLLNIIKLKDGDETKWVLKERGVVQDGTGRALKILTEEIVDKAFPIITNSQGRDAYKRQLYRFRHGLPGDVDHTKWF